jgi:hypothetical protein
MSVVVWGQTGRRTWLTKGNIWVAVSSSTRSLPNILTTAKEMGSAKLMRQSTKSCFVGNGVRGWSVWLRVGVWSPPSCWPSSLPSLSGGGCVLVMGGVGQSEATGAVHIPKRTSCEALSRHANQGLVNPD